MPTPRAGRRPSRTFRAADRHYRRWWQIRCNDGHGTTYVDDPALPAAYLRKVQDPATPRRPYLVFAGTKTWVIDAAVDVDDAYGQWCVRHAPGFFHDRDDIRIRPLVAADEAWIRDARALTPGAVDRLLGAVR